MGTNQAKLNTTITHSCASCLLRLQTLARSTQLQTACPQASLFGAASVNLDLFLWFVLLCVLTALLK